MEIERAREIVAGAETSTLASLAHGVESEEPLHDEDRDTVVAVLTLLAHGRETEVFSGAVTAARFTEEVGDDLGVPMERSVIDEAVAILRALAGDTGEGVG